MGLGWAFGVGRAIAMASMPLPSKPEGCSNDDLIDPGQRSWPKFPRNHWHTWGAPSPPEHPTPISSGGGGGCASLLVKLHLEKPQTTSLGFTRWGSRASSVYPQQGGKQKGGSGGGSRFPPAGGPPHPFRRIRREECPPGSN